MTRRTAQTDAMCAALLSLALVATGGWSQEGESIEDLRFVFEFGTQGAAAGQFLEPFGIAIDSEDRVIVADTWNHRIQICTLDGECSAFGGQGPEQGRFYYPMGLALGEQGTIVIADRENDRVQLCDYGGGCEILMDEEGVARVFSEPRDVAVMSDGKLVVTEPRRSSFHICRHKGECDSFDDIDGEPNLFVRPQTVAVDSADNIYFATSLAEIWRCDALGECQKLFGVLGADSGQFIDPEDLIVDADGRLVIADKDNQRIQICSVQGDCEAYQVRRSAKQLFYRPTAVALDSANRLVVAETGGDKIQVYVRVTYDGPLLPISAAMNDAWYQPATDGQGFFMYVYEQTQIVFLTWFTYDAQRPDSGQGSALGGAGQRWLTAQGNYDKYHANLTLHNTTSGVFLQEIPEPKTAPIGSLNLFFRDCETVEVSVSITEAGINEKIDVSRLASDGIALCKQHVPER